MRTIVGRGNAGASRRRIGAAPRHPGGGRAVVVGIATAALAGWLISAKVGPPPTAGGLGLLRADSLQAASTRAASTKAASTQADSLRAASTESASRESSNGTSPTDSVSTESASRESSNGTSPTEPASTESAPTEYGVDVERVRTVPDTSPSGERAEVRWGTVLAQLDAVRERAWRQGSTALLTRVYAEGSPELTADRRHLRAYLARGLRVEGVSLTVRRLTVVAVRDGWVRLRVVERLGPVEAMTVDGRARALPSDRPTRHLIDLSREGGWRIARVVAGSEARG